MLRWFERAETSSGNVVYSRVRLARNWDAVYLLMSCESLFTGNILCG